MLTTTLKNISEKALKLKQAKEEAKAEVSKFTKEREAEFKVAIKTCFLFVEIVSLLNILIKL